MNARDRRRQFVMLALLGGLACTVPTGSDLGNGLIETHHAIVDGVVRGEADQPLEDVDIVLRFAESSLPAPNTRTDGAGRFALVLAVYNGSPGPDSAAATVYAFTRPTLHSTSAASHANIIVRFLPKAQDAPRTSVSLKLPVF